MTTTLGLVNLRQPCGARTARRAHRRTIDKVPSWKLPRSTRASTAQSIVPNPDFSSPRIRSKDITRVTPRVGETGDAPYRVYDPELGRFLQRDPFPAAVKALQKSRGNALGIYGGSIFQRLLWKMKKSDLTGTSLRSLNQYSAYFIPNQTDPTGFDVTIVLSDGTTLVVSNAADLVTAITNNVPPGSIQSLSIYGHGGLRTTTQDLDESDKDGSRLQNLDFEGPTLFGKGLPSEGIPLSKLLAGKLSPHPEINLHGCNTGDINANKSELSQRNVQNIAQAISATFPNAVVTGQQGKFFTFPGTSVPNVIRNAVNYLNTGTDHQTTWQGGNFVDTTPTSNDWFPAGG